MIFYGMYKNSFLHFPRATKLLLTWYVLAFVNYTHAIMIIRSFLHAPPPRMISFVIKAQKHEHNLVSDVESLILDSKLNKVTL